MEQSQSRKKALLLGIGISLAYAASYVAKTVLSGIVPLIAKDGLFTETDIGKMGSAFMLTYGIGQLINGVVGDLVSPKKMIFTGLIGTGGLVLFFPMIGSVNISFILWGLVGFLCSMLWGPLSKVVAENTENKVARILMLLLTAASIFGSMLAYIICAVVSYWKNAFLISGIYIIINSFIWFVIITYMEKNNLLRYKSRVSKTLEGQQGEVLTLKYLIANAIIPVTVCIMLNGVIRNAASFWIPRYINEEFGMSPAFSSAIMILSPIINLIGTVITYKMLKLFKDDEHMLCAVLFAFSSLMFILILLSEKVMIIAIASMFLAGAAMSGVCNILFSVYVLRFSNTGRTSGITGSLDFTAYMLSSLANSLIGIWKVKFSWSFVITSWFLVTLAGAFSSYASHVVTKKSKV